VYSIAAIAASIANVGAGRSISANLNEQDWHDAVAKNWDGYHIVGQDGIRVEL